MSKNSLAIDLLSCSGHKNMIFNVSYIIFAVINSHEPFQCQINRKDKKLQTFDNLY